MKKILNLVIIAFFMLTTLTGCVTTEAATTVSAEQEYYDAELNYVIVYIDGIANYRFWDYTYRRWYYRPVPRERFGYIRMRPYNHHHAVPSHRPHREHRPDAVHPRTHHDSYNNRRSDIRPSRPNHNNNYIHHQPNHQQRSSTRHSQSHGSHFGGRR